MSEKISRNMIVSPKSFGKGSVILLTALSEEEILSKSETGIGSPLNAPELTVLPLTRKVSEIYTSLHGGAPGEFVTVDGRPATILTDNRRGTSYKYVGLIDSGTGFGTDIVECWDDDGHPESEDPNNQLGDYPYERYGFIAIYRGCVSDHVYPDKEEAVRALANRLGRDVSSLSPDEIFCIQVSAWVDQDEKVI